MKLLRNKKIKITIVLILILAIAFVIYKFVFNKSGTTQISQEEISVMSLKGVLKDTVSASGQVETANYLAVTTSVSGIVNKVYVREGDTVQKGDPIMDITLSSEGQETLSSAWSSYMSAKNSLESSKTSLISLESNLLTSEKAFESEKENNSYQSEEERDSYTLAENAYNVAKSNYEIQKETIKQKGSDLNKAWLTYQAQSPTILAPESGVVANIVVVQGMEISNSLSERTSSTVASIKREGTPIASLNVSEVDINKVQVGQKVEINLSSISDKTFTGEVVGIDKIGTISSGVSNYPVIVKFTEDSSLVLPNMGVDAEIIVQEKADTVYVPTSAISTRQGKTIVRIKENEKISPVEVVTGISTSEFTEIISGINEGVTVLVSSLPTTGFTSSTEGKMQNVFMGGGPAMGGTRRQ